MSSLYGQQIWFFFLISYIYNLYTSWKTEKNRKVDYFRPKTFMNRRWESMSNLNVYNSMRHYNFTMIKLKRKTHVCVFTVLVPLQRFIYPHDIELKLVRKIMEGRWKPEDVIRRELHKRPRKTVRQPSCTLLEEKRRP